MRYPAHHLFMRIDERILQLVGTHGITSQAHLQALVTAVDTVFAASIARILGLRP